ncbi:MAG: dynamin family protein [Lachnospiraceae bacterium]|nr:dynamin family protein [Lachnospiraceae bacterium]
MDVKIISNPYEQIITYERRKNSNDEWKKVEEGELFTKKLTEGFFPFIVEDIIDSIIKQYYDSKEKINILFEGPGDEFKELEQALDVGTFEETPYSEYILIENSDRYLDNARDILPDIKFLYNQRIKPLITEYLPDQTAIQKDLAKYAEASDNTIPICVIGNYSSGKSTFINALIGREVLPSSDKPTTSKYYKITNSRQEDRATIAFKYENSDVSIRFEAEKYVFTETKPEVEMIERIEKTLSDNLKENVIVKLNRTVEIINSFEKEKGIQCISDLIYIRVPFGKGIGQESNSNFVIIDTPGSNSVSNTNHARVLEKAMEGLTNGLPIFVSRPDGLDTKDNMELIEKIKNMEELDNRFTIIVINQGDKARLNKDGFTQEEIEKTLSQAIPKSFDTENIYYVSSIMGLGIKVDGKLIDNGYAETYEDSYNKFTNPESRFYKELYKFNIIPERKKLQTLEEIKKQNNLLLANSGLLSIEKEIKTFAEKYSHYNKCQQSVLFLSKVINISKEQLAIEKKKHTDSMEKLKIDMEEEKGILIDNITDKSEELKQLFYEEDKPYFKNVINEKIYDYKNVNVKKKESELKNKNEDINDKKGKIKNIFDSIDAIRDGISSNVEEVFKNKNVKEIKKIAPDLFEDLGETYDKIKDSYNTSRKIKKDTAEDLVTYMDQLYKEASKEMQVVIFDSSVDYWIRKSNEVRDELGKIVRDTDALTDDERNKIAGIIINFDEITITQTEEVIFLKSKFDYAIRIRKLRIDISDDIMINKLSKSFKEKLTENVENIEMQIVKNHEIIFGEWLEQLNGQLINNIVEFNPKLHDMSDEIRLESERINKYESLLIDLEHYKKSIEDKMKWNYDKS